MKLRNIKLSNWMLIVLLIILFIIGNRFSLLAQLYHKQGMQVFLIPFNALLDILISFKPSVLGFSIGFDIISIISGLFFDAGFFIAMIWGMTLRKNYRAGEEHGSARYGDMETEAKPLRDPHNEDNDMILSESVRVSMDTRLTWLNDNVLVIGGSGSGKTRFHVKPNILQMNCNYIITDPKFSLVPEVGQAFVDAGYDIKILNLKDMSKSMRYNPFKYVKKPNDIFKLINNIVANTTKENGNNGGDDFFVKSEVALMTATAFYIMAVGTEDERNITTLMDLIDLAEASEEDENMESLLDIMFQNLAESNKVLRERGLMNKNDYAYLAERQYSLYKKAAGKTAKSILISVGVRMGIFNLPELSNLLCNDELDLETIGKPKKDKNGNYIKTVFFVGISDSDSTFTFIAAILYQQLFDLLYLIADENEGGRLPIHTRFELDEFSNVGKIPDFEIKIATMRSREISVCVILQNLAQLKNTYKDSWETIFGNADSTVFLGGKEPSTLKYISELIGNTTIDYLSINENRGGQSGGSWSRTNNLISRALLAPDEIGRLKKDECLVHIRGQHIFRDKKYDLLKHKRITSTTDCPDKSKAKVNLFDPTECIQEAERKYRLYVEELPEEAGTECKGDDYIYVRANELDSFMNDMG